MISVTANSLLQCSICTNNHMVISFVAVFVACWLPRQVYILWYHYDTGQFNMFWHIFKIAALCLSYTNSCLNPFALYLLSRQFRDHYDRLLFSRLKFNTAAAAADEFHITRKTALNRSLGWTPPWPPLVDTPIAENTYRKRWELRIARGARRTDRR